GASKGYHTTDGVYDCGSCEVAEALSQTGKEVILGAHEHQPAIRPPGPVTDDGIDETCNTDAIEDIAAEAGTTDHRAGGHRRGSVCESELEYPVSQYRNARATVGIGSILEEEPGFGVTACQGAAAPSDKTIALTKHKGISDGPEEDAAYARIE